MNHINKLQTRLEKVSDQKTKKWFENYLKNVISYRGVKTPTVAKIVSHWRVDEAIDKLPLKKQMEIACDLIREKKAKDKFAGIIYISLEQARDRYHPSELQQSLRSGSVLGLVNYRLVFHSGS